jgi:hypothetical protein
VVLSDAWLGSPLIELDGIYFHWCSLNQRKNAIANCLQFLCSMTRFNTRPCDGELGTNACLGIRAYFFGGVGAAPPLTLVYADLSHPGSNTRCLVGGSSTCQDLLCSCVLYLGAAQNRGSSAVKVSARHYRACQELATYGPETWLTNT